MGGARATAGLSIQGFGGGREEGERVDVAQSTIHLQPLSSPLRFRAELSFSLPPLLLFAAPLPRTSIDARVAASNTFCKQGFVSGNGQSHRLSQSIPTSTPSLRSAEHSWYDLAPICKATSFP